MLLRAATWALLLGVLSATTQAQSGPALPSLTPLERVIDLRVGESAEVQLSDGTPCRLELLRVQEQTDPLCFAVREAVVTVRVNDEQVELRSGNYRLPVAAGGAQIDCPVTKGYNVNGTPSFWGLEKDARLRLWPRKSDWIQAGTFGYPVKQRWFASDTQMANEPVFVDGGDQAGQRKIYYHSGLDIGGSEGLVEVVAATDGLIVSVGEVVLDGHRQDTPVEPRYDVVYLLDARGWYYRYSHLKDFDPAIIPGRLIKMGQRIGHLGKEGGSGGWSHLHFEIKARQPSGKWGTQEGFAFLWQAYLREQQPAVIAVARPHRLVQTGDEVVLDASRSWARSGKIARYVWKCGDGQTAEGPQFRRQYLTPGRHSEVLQVTDSEGNVSYDFAVVLVADREHPQRPIPSIHANYFPTFGIQPGQPVTFKVRTFQVSDGRQGTERWDFGDGTPPVEVHSDGNAVKLAPDGYATTTHTFARSGDYVVRVERRSPEGVPAVAHLQVTVAAVKP